MKTKSFILSLSLLTPMIGTMGAQAAPYNKFNYNFYAGTSVGYLNSKHNYTCPQQALGMTRVFKKSRTKHSVLPEIYLGYRHFFDNFLIGIELNGNYAFGGTSFKPGVNPNAKYSFKRTFSFHPQLVIGAAIANNMTVYAKVGPNIAHYKYSTYLINDQKRHSHKKTLTSFAGHLGFEYHHCNTYGTRFEIGFTPGKTIKAKKPYVDTNNITYQPKFKGRELTTKLGIFFKFA